MVECLLCQFELSVEYDMIGLECLQVDVVWVLEGDREHRYAATDSTHAAPSMALVFADNAGSVAIDAGRICRRIE